MRLISSSFSDSAKQGSVYRVELPKLAFCEITRRLYANRRQPFEYLVPSFGLALTWNTESPMYGSMFWGSQLSQSKTISFLI